MHFNPGDLVAINTMFGRRNFELRFPAICMVDFRGIRGIVLEVVTEQWRPIYCKVLVGGSGVWWIESKLISPIRLEFRVKELRELDALKQQGKIG
jgi:hypothetical protein